MTFSNLSTGTLALIREAWARRSEGWRSSDAIMAGTHK